MKIKTPVLHATFAAMWPYIPRSPDFTPEFAAILDDYLNVFACPPDASEDKPRHPCLKCGAPYAGFRWSIQHGEGNCSSCGWPARAYHFVKDENGVEVKISMTLQYHPDLVTTRRKRKQQGGRLPDAAGTDVSQPGK